MTRRRMPRRRLEEVLGHPVSDEQWGCISAPMQPFVIVAGAGTGKTTVMAARVLWLVASGLAADHEVLGLTFTNKAAAELAHRVAVLLDRWRARTPADLGFLGEPTIATYHSFASSLIAEQGLRVGIEPGARLLPAAAVAQIAHGVVCRAEGMRHWATSPARLTAEVVALDANLAEQSISTEELRAHDRAVLAEVEALPRPTRPARDIAGAAARRLELADLVDQVRAARAEAGVDFADQMRLCVALAESSDELVAALRRTYRVVLLDEYQDTSIAQRMILSTLFAGTPVTAVGDPLQAIYGWRSASVANIASFAEHFGATGADPVRVLSVNRRSGAAILSGANRIAAGLRRAHPEVAPLRPPGPAPASVRAALLPSIDEEREWVADRVGELVSSGVAAQDIAVLARTNEALVPLQRSIAARGVPASIAGVVPLAASPFAAEALATLRVLHDAGDNTALAALLAGPRWRLGADDLAALGRRAAQLAARARGAAGPGDAVDRTDLGQRLQAAIPVVDPVHQPSLLEAAADPGPGVGDEARRRLAAFVGQLRLLQADVGRPLAELVATVVAALGADVESDLAGSEDPDPGLAGLLALVDGFADAAGGTGLGPFLAYLEAAEQLGEREVVDLPIVAGSVQMMTMHKAKGLEFTAVILPHLCRDVFPGTVGSDRWTTRPSVVPSELRDDHHVLPALTGFTTPQLTAFVEDCRAHDRSGDDRLAYVAVTRARQVLIGSGHWWGPTQRRPRGPSPYLEALRAEAAEPDPWAPAPAPDLPGDDPANPMLDSTREVPWPPVAPGADDPARAAADAVEALVASGTAAHPWQARPGPEQPGSPDPIVADWDAAISALLARDADAAAPRAVRLPGVLTASAVTDLAADPDGFAERLVRPMPRRRNRHADLGTAFHAWVETRLGIQPLITDEDLPGAADAGIESEEDLDRLKEGFEQLPYAHRTPVGLEVPFAVALPGRLVRGRIDAVFRAGPGSPPGVQWEVVDWKTSAAESADPLQLAVYRLAWAGLAGVDVAAVGAAFVYVRTRRVVRYDALPGAAELAALLAGAGPR